MRKLVLVLLLSLVIGLVSCQAIPGTAPYTETSFTVAAGEKHTVSVELRAGGTLQGSFSISGAESFVDFYVKGPTGALAYGVVRAVGGEAFQVRAEVSGTFTLYFDNAISFGSARQISLRYRAD